MRRVSALFVVAAMLAAVFAVWRPGHAAAALCSNPAVTGVSPQVAASGATITVSGSGFQNLLCTTTLNVGGVTPSNKPVVVNDSTMTFIAQDGMHGGVVVSQSGVGGTNTSNTNVAFYVPPTVTGIGPAAPRVGDAVTVSGHGFNFLVPNGYERVSATYPGGCAGPSAGLTSDSAITISPPGSFCAGGVGLTITAPSNLADPTSQIQVYKATVGSIDVQASGMHLASSSAVAGQTVEVDGSGFGSSGSATVGGAPASVASWADTAVVVQVPNTAVSNSPVALTRGGDNANIAVPGTLGVVAHMDSLSPTTASAGDTVSINGGGFGTDPGTVTLASTNLPVTSWSPTVITVKVPAGSQSGDIAIAPKDTSAPANTLALKVIIPTPTIGAPGGSSGSSGSAGSNATPLTPAQVQQVTSALSAPPPPLPTPQVGGPAPALPPSHPTNGLVAMSLKTSSTSALPGKTVPFTVTLKAYGRPVANAAVQMVIAYEPAKDGSVTPVSGVTNAKGQFRGTVHLSKTPGEMIVLARSGEFSDEVQLVGSTSASAHISGGAGSPAAVVPVLVVVLAALLIVAGVGLRVALAVTSRHGIGAALLRERLGIGPAAISRRLRWSRWMPRAWDVPRPRLRSRRQVETGGDTPAEAEVTAEPQPAAVLGALGSDATPDEQKERLEVHS